MAVGRRLWGIAELEIAAAMATLSVEALGYVAAHGPGIPYRLDVGERMNAGTWYRIEEITVSGPGDGTTCFCVEDDPGRSTERRRPM